MAARHIIGHLLPHAVAGALKEARPEHVMAEGSANIWGVQVAGKDEAGVLGTPVEVIESLSPLLIEKKALRDGSGGRGRYRGGLGQEIAFRVRTGEPYVCSVLCDRTQVPAQGFFGGEPGAPGQVLVNGHAPANPKAEQALPPGALVEIRLPGGGGYGPSADRDPALIARDRLEGYAG